MLLALPRGLFETYEPIQADQNLRRAGDKNLTSISDSPDRPCISGVAGVDAFPLASAVSDALPVSIGDIEDRLPNRLGPPDASVSLFIADAGWSECFFFRRACKV
jgi:hypothetical protein